MATLLISSFAGCNSNERPTGVQLTQNVDEQSEGQPTEAVRVPMNNQRLGTLLKKHFPDRKIEGRPGLWQIALADEKANASKTELEDEQADPAADGEEGAAEANGEQEGEPAPEGESGPGATKHLPPVLVVMTDERADRMRIMIPIRPFDPKNVEDLQLALIALHANYDRALDARYAVQDGVLWSAFIHPLESLTPSDFASGLRQVRGLRENTGSTYSSGELLFAPQGGGEAPAEKLKESDKKLDDNIT